MVVKASTRAFSAEIQELHYDIMIIRLASRALATSASTSRGVVQYNATILKSWFANRVNIGQVCVGNDLVL